MNHNRFIEKKWLQPGSKELDFCPTDGELLKRIMIREPQLGYKFHKTTLYISKCLKCGFEKGDLR